MWVLSSCCWKESEQGQFLKSWTAPLRGRIWAEELKTGWDVTVCLCSEGPAEVIKVHDGSWFCHTHTHTHTHVHTHTQRSPIWRWRRLRSEASCPPPPDGPAWLPSEAPSENTHTHVEIWTVKNTNTHTLVLIQAYTPSVWTHTQFTHSTSRSSYTVNWLWRKHDGAKLQLMYLIKYLNISAVDHPDVFKYLRTFLLPVFRLVSEAEERKWLICIKSCFEVNSWLISCYRFGCELQTDCSVIIWAVIQPNGR